MKQRISLQYLAANTTTDTICEVGLKLRPTLHIVSVKWLNGKRQKRKNNQFISIVDWNIGLCCRASDCLLSKDRLAAKMIATRSSQAPKVAQKIKPM